MTSVSRKSNDELPFTVPGRLGSSSAMLRVPRGLKYSVRVTRVQGYCGEQSLLRSPSVLSVIALTRFERLLPFSYCWSR